MEPTPTARPKQKKPKDDSPDIKRSPVDLCGHCGKNCRDKVLNKAIQCDLYAAWVHASCEGVSSDDYKLFTNLNSSESVIYYCNLNQCLSQVKHCFPTLLQKKLKSLLTRLKSFYHQRCSLSSRLSVIQCPPFPIRSRVFVLKMNNCRVNLTPPFHL